MTSKINKLYEKINNNEKKVIVFGLSYCEYCKNTIIHLKNNNISFKYYKIDKYYNIFFNLLSELSKVYTNLNINLNHTTFPVIFINQKFIGGYTDLIKIK